jgi:hypothetical protein
MRCKRFYLFSYVITVNRVCHRDVAILGDVDRMVWWGDDMNTDLKFTFGIVVSAFAVILMCCFIVIAS